MWILKLCIFFLVGVNVLLLKRNFKRGLSEYEIDVAVVSTIALVECSILLFMLTR